MAMVCKLISCYQQVLLRMQLLFKSPLGVEANTSDVLICAEITPYPKHFPKKREYVSPRVGVVGVKNQSKYDG